MITYLILEKENSRSKVKNKFKVITSATSGLAGGAEIKSREDKHKFTVVFKNETKDSAPVNIYWINHQGKEILKKDNLAFGEEYLASTHFSHPWIFRKSPGVGDKLMADGNGIQNVTFEGEKFLAVPNEKLMVLIAESKL